MMDCCAGYRQEAHQLPGSADRRWLTMSDRRGNGCDNMRSPPAAKCDLHNPTSIKRFPSHRSQLESVSSHSCPIELGSPFTPSPLPIRTSTSPMFSLSEFPQLTSIQKNANTGCRTTKMIPCPGHTSQVHTVLLLRAQQPQPSQSVSGGTRAFPPPWG